MNRHLPSRGRTRPIHRPAAGLASALLILGALAGPTRAAAEANPAPAPDHTFRSFREYAVPDIRLVRDDGKTISLPEEMDDGRPVLLQFIFTTCTSFCPLLSSIFSGFEARLGDQARKVRLMSISIDPEYDTPERLREYVRRFKPGPEWHHYTGTLEASIAAQRAFDVYRGTKMNHNPVTFLRIAPGKPWLRIEGFVKPDDLVREYRGLVAAR
jgi:protein SCO1/2